ncbi:glycosyltransferase [Aeromonas hydrophila]|uniref:glycosyltransferase n=1 Tax=Aeromonas hydrophila TaxID=644 RepID=UPI00249E2F16|nr:glycosyltransferase [Aeromonas hydrophila]WGY32359.1 glycosyltransferase [Aeromonas hydrophila]HDC4322747.1 glycosyltransferase [Aeromonas hydrophila]
MKKKVLFVMKTLEGGGAEKVLVNILNHLDEAKYEITLLLLKYEGVYLSSLPSYIKVKYLLGPEPTGFLRRGVIYSMKKRWYSLVLAKPWLANALLPDYYDVGVSFLEGDASLLLSYLNGPQKKIAWVHIDLERHHTLPREIEKVVYERMDEVVCVSEGVKQSVLNLHPVLESNISVIYNPVDTTFIAAKGQESIKVGRGLNVLAIGRLLNSQKAFDLLLAAHHQNIAAGMDYHLTILGEGSDREVLEKYIQEHQLSDHTSLLGFQDNPYPYIAGCDLFVMSSRYEGYPVVLVEAMTLGKAIVSTACTGPQEALNDGEFGYLVPVNDVNTLAKGIKTLLEDQGVRERYASLSKQRADIFSFRRSMMDVERLLDTQS